MEYKLWRLPILILGLVVSTFSYAHGYQRYWGGNVIIINTPPFGGYYNNYNPYYNSYNYPYYNPYYNPTYNPYYYYPRYRCLTVPRCYPSGSCNYQNQECGYY
ncbi:hypothetical protein [Legionella jordanis]|uniref:Uncharacterized protein n=1 Tax=Legionella jordanis TaxID=456 RepID=A0A0W0VCH9_9GAMM|nr:hypothetical protein [Legionella jordanis]KTD17305.1 hypothetical protein Ljor_1611 [Legionella jordanis]RMW99452.1 hypothetical protein EAW55_13685 [Legionella jordanis]VEH12496.1 Uncharacterised protein [Legionella jordanis]HAT8715222.1 hypothetical protein [Legionella jordanis]